MTDELTIGFCLDDAESVCSDDSICYSDISAGEISLCTDFGDVLHWSDIDDDFANLEQNDDLAKLERNDDLANLEWNDDLANLERNDDLANLERNDDLVSLEQSDAISSTEPSTSAEHTNIQQPVDTVGYAIIGDNIDKNVRPSYQRQDRTTKSLHYFHFYALKNHINILQMSDKRPSSIDISPKNILPSQSDSEK